MGEAAVLGLPQFTIYPQLNAGDTGTVAGHGVDGYRIAHPHTLALARRADQHHRLAHPSRPE
jgi:hypothetical protein